MFQITKEFTFEAAHRLLGHPKCGRLHGHSYRVMVELQAAELNLDHPVNRPLAPTSGMVRDYADLSGIKEYIDSHLDHRYLVSDELIRAVDMYERVSPDENAYLSVERTTAECLAKYLFDLFSHDYPELTAVTVCETAKTAATYRLERGLR